MALSTLMQNSDTLPIKNPNHLSIIIEDGVSDTVEDDDISKQDKTLMTAKLNKVSLVS